MRKALNNNPVVQIVILGVLGVVVAFLLVTRVMHSSGPTASTTPTTSATGVPAAPASTAGSTAPTTPPGATQVAPAPGVPSTAAPATPGTAGVGSAAGPVPSISAKLIAGPGLPKPVASAYAQGKAIVLFVFRNHGIDDNAVRASVDRLRGRSGLAVFVTHAGHIARYARITEGVDVNRVPALIVVRPRRLVHGAPRASVDYGFRGPGSVEQAVRDALYKGPTNLPYYPR